MSITHPNVPARWTRRAFIQAGAASAGLLLAAPETRVAAGRPNGRLIDVNVSLSRWPLRRLPADEPGRLVVKLRSRGVTQAWAGTLDGLLHKDIAAANQRLVEDCRRFGRGLLLPIASINPMLPDWVEETRRCARQDRVRGIRLHP